MKIVVKEPFEQELGLWCVKQQCDRGLSISWLTTQPISVIIQRSFYAFINVYTYDESKN